jgi:hypothetical protein
LSIAGLNFLLFAYILLDDRWIKSGVAWHKFWILVFSARLNYEKLMPCKYFTLLLFFINLEISTTKIKAFTNMALWTAR